MRLPFHALRLLFSPARGGLAGWRVGGFSAYEPAFFAGSGRDGGLLAYEPAFLAGSACPSRGFCLFAR
ncbi:hypothetical protein HQN90_35370 [Paenibacillus alba]|nr:hypothetical protein [Paenibacillus alba]